MTEQQLNEYSIYTLREVARQAGVKSPTSKKKEVLIKEILEISQGKKEPVTNKSKQGRPPKNFGYSFINITNPEKSYFGNSLTTLTFNQKTEEFKKVEDLTVAGYVEQVNLNTAFLWVANGLEFNCYLISNLLVAKFNLKTGDLLTAETGVDEERMMIKDIYSINGCPINKYQTNRVDYLKLIHTPANKKIEVSEFENLGLLYGESVYLYGANNNVNSKMLIKLLNSCNVRRKLYLNLSIAEKNKHLLNEIKNAELFVADVMEGTEKSKKLINIATERAKRLMENGEDVILVMDDVMSCWAIDEPEHCAIKKAISVTKNAGKKGSIALMAVMSEDASLKIFEKLADKRFKILDGEIVLR